MTPDPQPPDAAADSKRGLALRARRLLPFLAWPRADAATMRADAWAGATVGLMVIPQGIAYAVLAGMPPVTGIYASMLPTLVAVLFGGSPRLSVGPTALTCLMVASSLTALAEPGSAQWIALAAWLALLSGLLQVVLGFARFGWLLNVVSSPVLMAFTQAAAVLIIGSQAGALLGLEQGWRPWVGPPQIHLGAAAFGLATLLVLLVASRWRPTVPVVLIVVIATAGLSVWGGFEAAGGLVLGALPQGLPALGWPTFPGLDVLGALLLPSAVITLVSFLETASSAKVDNQRSGRRWNQDQDLIGQGLAKIAAGLCGAFPTSSSFSRSALVLFTGARTGWAMVFSVVVVLLALLVFTPVLEHVPQAVLAAIVCAAVLGLIRPREFVRLWRFSRVEAAIAALTFVVTLLSAPYLYWGVLAGVLMALSHFLYERLHPRIIEVGLHGDGSLRDRDLWGLPRLAPNLYALRMDAALDFAAASAFERAITERLAADHELRHVCVFAQSINRIDATGVETMAKIHAQLLARQVTLHVCGLKLPVENALRHSGVLPGAAMMATYRTEAEALKAFAELAETPPDISAAAI